MVSTPRVLPSVRRKRNLAGEFDKGEGVSLSAGIQTENMLPVNSQPAPDAGPSSHPLMLSAGRGECWDGRSVHCSGGGSDAVGWYDTGAVGGPRWGATHVGESGPQSSGGWEWQGWQSVASPVCHSYGGLGSWRGVGGSPVNAMCLGCQKWGSVVSYG